MYLVPKLNPTRKSPHTSPNRFNLSDRDSCVFLPNCQQQMGLVFGAGG